MAAYVIVNDDITDEGTFSEFRERVGATVEANGGRYLVRSGNAELIEGNWSPGRMVVIEFDDASAARGWLNSPEYTELKRIRQRSANASLILVEGV
ncbi:MAG: DUF1330 domain-containing protein [Gammaproteobacteria bacterium]|nr:DUF1330 domain-containing protein [Gammaproteobacteria bacterium]MYD79262.1 DUF1330 domain-containing protein [Gammaproteobacteria bacterium]